MSDKQLVEKLLKFAKEMRDFLAKKSNEDESSLNKAIRDTKSLGIPTPSKPGNELETTMPSPEQQSGIRTAQKEQTMSDRERVRDMIVNPHKYFAGARPKDMDTYDVKPHIRRATAEGGQEIKAKEAQAKAQEDQIKEAKRKELHRQAYVEHKPSARVDVVDPLKEGEDKHVYTKQGNVKQVPLNVLADVAEQQKPLRSAAAVSKPKSEFLQPSAESTAQPTMSPADLAATKNLQSVKEQRTLSPEETLRREGNLLHSDTEHEPAHIRDGLRADKTLQMLYNEKSKASVPKNVRDQIDRAISLRRQERTAELDKEHGTK